MRFQVDHHQLHQLLLVRIVPEAFREGILTTSAAPNPR